MPDVSILLVITIIIALIFDFTNGFHDTANAIASAVATRVLSPEVAVAMAAVFNFIGALISTHVAKTIAEGLVDPGQVSNVVVLAAILGAITWNLITWWWALPSSSSHALIGGLVGAALIYGGTDAVYPTAIWNKVLAPMVIVPAIGFVAGLLVMALIYFSCAKLQIGSVSNAFQKLQVAASAVKALAHGQSDAQKTMGIITFSLFTSGVYTGHEIPVWVVLSCASAIALGTALGGWRIIKTLATGIMPMKPVHGFAADASAGFLIIVASLFGMPISTSHVVSASIFGVGTATRPKALRWTVGQNIIMAWVLTLPAAAIMSAIYYGLFYLAGVK